MMRRNRGKHIYYIGKSKRIGNLYTNLVKDLRDSGIKEETPERLGEGSSDGKLHIMREHSEFEFDFLTRS